MQKQLPKNARLVVFQGENDERLAVWDISELQDLLNETKKDMARFILSGYEDVNDFISKNVNIFPSSNGIDYDDNSYELADYFFELQKLCGFKNAVEKKIKNDEDVPF